MTVETFDVQDIVHVTDSAAEHFRKQLEAKVLKAIRLSLKESGCTGYKYVIDEVDGAEEDDIEVVLSNGTPLYIDPKHLSAFRGTTIDFVQEGLNQNLVLKNPNVKDECGCGESFNF